MTKKVIALLGLILALVGFIFFFYQKVIKLVQATIFNFWIEPLQKILRLTSLDYDSTWPTWFNKVIAGLKDFGWLLMTVGKVNVTQFKGEDWSVIFVHDDFTFHAEMEISQILFPTPPEVKFRKRIFIWQIPSLLPQFLNDSDLVVCELNRLIKWQPHGIKYLFRSPPWLRMKLAIPPKLSDLTDNMANGRRRSLVKMQKQGFTYQFSHNPADLELFYYKMHVPYIAYRHEAKPEPFETKQAMFKKGGLIMVKYQGETVASALRHTIGSTLIAGSLGVHEDHFDLFDKGVVLALTWYTIEWAHQQNLHHVEFGLTRAQLHDDVFWARVLWGMQIQPNLLDDHTYRLFATNHLPITLGKFLNKTTFIAEVDGGYSCVVFGGEEFGLTDEELANIQKISPRVGLKNVLILS